MNRIFFLLLLLIQLAVLSVSSPAENVQNGEAIAKSDDIRVNGVRYWSVEVPAGAGLKYIGAIKRDDGSYLVVTPQSADIEYFDSERKKWAPLQGYDWASYSDLDKAENVPKGKAIKILVRGDVPLDINRKYRLSVRNYKEKDIRKWGELIVLPLIKAP
jgi:hypothetical protein